MPQLPEGPKVVEFREGLVIDSTQNYYVICGYKEGLEGKKEGQRNFLVPKSREAEQILVQFAVGNCNVLTDRPFGAKGDETIKAVRFNGPTEYLLDCLHSEKGQEPGILGCGIPSLSYLEARIG